MRCNTASQNLYRSRTFIGAPSELAREALYYVTACGQFFGEESCQFVLGEAHNYLLFYVLEGEAFVTYEGRTMVADKGKTGLVAIEKLEEYHTSGETEIFWMHLDGCNIASIYQHILELYKGFVFSHKKGREFRYMFKQLIDGHQPESLLSEAEKSRQIYDMLMHLLDGAVSVCGGGSRWMSYMKLP